MSPSLHNTLVDDMYYNAVVSAIQKFRRPELTDCTSHIRFFSISYD